MLVGMGLMKLGVFSARRPQSFYARCVLLGYGIGLPLVVHSARTLYAHEFDFIYAFKVGNYFNYLGSLAVAMGHVGVIMLVYQSGVLPRLRRWLAQVGRMALTNYLLQSVICTLFFYGYGFGFFGRLNRVGQMGVVLAIWILLLVISPLWMSRFRFGPAEWCWRFLTYGRRQLKS